MDIAILVTYAIATAANAWSVAIHWQGSPYGTYLPGKIVRAASISGACLGALAVLTGDQLIEVLR